MKKILYTGLIALFLTGCASSSVTVPDLSVEQLYTQGFSALQEKDYTKAARYFDAIEQQHPYSIWAPRSQIMAAFTYYSENKYDDALLTLERFIQLHPGNKNIAYAYYLQGLCYFEQMSDITREQKMTQDALDSFNTLTVRFPDSIYIPDVNQKFQEIESHLAGKEMDVGRYYLQKTDFIPALNRFQAVLETHPRSKQTPEALYRITTIYLSLGMDKQAQSTSQHLKKYYPKTTWTTKAENLILKYMDSNK